MADYYELLGVSRSATRRRAQAGVPPAGPRAAPRRQPRRPAAAEQFKEVARAYEVLSDPEQRARYDRFGEAGVGGASGGPNVDDIFSAAGSATCSTRFFGGTAAVRRRSARSRPARRVARTSRSSADIAFEQAVFGATVPVTLRTPQRCDDCDGTGRRRRHAAGHVRRVQRPRPGAAGAPEPARPDGHHVGPARAAAASARSS